MHSTHERLIALKEQQLAFEIEKFMAEQDEKKVKPPVKLFNPVVATILVALIGVGSSIYANLQQNKFAADLEKRKFEFDLVKRGLDIDTVERSKYFKLLYTYKLVQDSNLRTALSNFIIHPESAPNLGTLGSVPIDTSAHIRLKNYRLGALTAARLKIGTMEDLERANNGVDVFKYMRGGVGMPWSAAFVSWCYSQNFAGSPPFVYTYSFDAIVSDLKKHGWYKDSTYTPQPGDIFIGNRRNNSGHFGGIVESVTKDSVIVIEGNTSIDGGPNGNGVFRKKRSRMSNVQFGKIPDDLLK